MKNHNLDRSLLKNNEQLDLLFREKLGIIQNPQFFSFSLDAILLADFVRLNKNSQAIIDFCSGNGIIPLLLSHKTDYSITGVEVQASLVEMARRSIEMNGLEQQINMIHLDLNDFQRRNVLYDVVTCNPPYFTFDNQNQEHKLKSHAIARHEILLTLDQWISKASQILKIKGRLFFVHRPNRLDEITETLLQHNFSIHRMQFVHPKKDKNANMVLIEAIYGGNQAGVNVLPPLVVYNEDNNYTTDLQKIYYGEVG